MDYKIVSYLFQNNGRRNFIRVHQRTSNDFMFTDLLNNEAKQHPLPFGHISPEFKGKTYQNVCFFQSTVFPQCFNEIC